MRIKYSKVIQPYVEHLNRVLTLTVTDSRLDVLETEAALVLIARYQSERLLPLELSSTTGEAVAALLAKRAGEGQQGGGGPGALCWGLRRAGGDAGGRGMG